MGLAASGVSNRDGGSAQIGILPVGVEVIGTLTRIPSGGIVVIASTSIRVDRHAGCVGMTWNLGRIQRDRFRPTSLAQPVGGEPRTIAGVNGRPAAQVGEVRMVPLEPVAMKRPLAW